MTQLRIIPLTSDIDENPRKKRKVAKPKRGSFKYEWGTIEHVHQGVSVRDIFGKQIFLLKPIKIIPSKIEMLNLLKSRKISVSHPKFNAFINCAERYIKTREVGMPISCYEKNFFDKKAPIDFFNEKTQIGESTSISLERKRKSGIIYFCAVHSHPKDYKDLTMTYSSEDLAGITSFGISHLFYCMEFLYVHNHLLVLMINPNRKIHFDVPNTRIIRDNIAYPAAKKIHHAAIAKSGQRINIIATKKAVELYNSAVHSICKHCGYPTYELSLSHNPETAIDYVIDLVHADKGKL